MTTYWRIHKPENEKEDRLTQYYTCQVCKFFHSKTNRKNAVVELRGLAKKDLLFEESTEGELIRVCQRHFEELKEAGEIEA